MLREATLSASCWKLYFGPGDMRFARRDSTGKHGEYIFSIYLQNPLQRM